MIVGVQHLLKIWFSQDPHPGVGWLGHVVLCCWVSESLSLLLSRADALIYIPTQGRRVPFSPHPSCIYCQLFEMAMLTCDTWPLHAVKRYLIELLICISLVIRDTEHLFRCFMATWMPSLDKCPLRSWAHFSIRLFVFFYFELHEPCLPVLEVNSFCLHLKTLFFPHSEGCLFLSFVVYPPAQMLWRLMRSHLFSFLSKSESKVICLWFISKHVLPGFFSRGSQHLSSS